MNEDYLIVGEPQNTSSQGQAVIYKNISGTWTNVWDYRANYTNSYSCKVGSAVKTYKNSK